MSDTTDNELTPQEKARKFPTTPGVYLMKDAQAVVIYVGKAKNLRNRTAHYFTKEATVDLRTCELVKHIADIEFIPCESDVDALLTEARLIKDIRPKFNKALKDGKSFPYLQIRTREDYPRVEITRKPRRKGVRLFGPFTSATQLRMAFTVLQRVLKFRNCSLDIEEKDDRWRWYRPCLLHSIRQCTAPCNFRVTREEYRKQIRKLIMVLNGKTAKLIKHMETEMKEASAALLFEKAARIRDEIQALQNLNMRGDVDKHAQPEVFPIDPKRGMLALKKVLHLDKIPRTIEGVDIAHLQGSDTVASLVSFLDGLPFKDGYRRYKIRTVQGVDDFASMREVISRRFKHLTDSGEIFPDVLLIDGGKGQLSAVMEAFEAIHVTPPTVISLAKQEEEIFRPGEAESLKLSRNSAALRLLQYVRDEAHRFAQHYHHTLRRKKLTD